MPFTTKRGLDRANEKASNVNFHKNPSNWDAPIGTDNYTGAQTLAIKGVKYTTISNPTVEHTLPFDSEVALDASTITNLPIAIYEVIKQYSHDTVINASYATGNLTFSHEGQNTLGALILSNDTDVATTRT